MHQRTFNLFDIGFVSLLILASTPVWSQPNVAFLDIQPRLFGVAIATPLAAPTHGADESFEISLNLTIRNDELVTIELSQITMNFDPAVTPSSVSLSGNLLMQCDSGNLQPLSASAKLPPGASCTILLLKDTLIQPFVPEFFELMLFFDGFSPLSQILPIVGYVNARPQGGYQYPASASDLALGEYWSGRSDGSGSIHRQSTAQMFAFDLGVVRYDDASATWVDFHPPSPGETVNDDENEDFLVWGKPVRAMDDGVVVSCVDGNLDNDPSKDADNCEPGSVANSFVIDHGDERVSYLHFMKDSLNPGLCFNGALVQAGDQLGLAGNSGCSSAPHLHIHMTRGGQGFPINFRDTFLVDRSTYLDPPTGNADWEYVAGRSLPWEETIQWPSPIVRRATVNSGGVRAIELLQLTSDKTVTAYVDLAGELGLRSWDRAGDGELFLADENAGPEINGVAMAKPSVTSDFITAVRWPSGTLELTGWDDSLNQGLSVTSDPVVIVDITSSPHLPGVVTAARMPDNALEVKAWDYDWILGISEGGSAQAGQVTKVAVATGEAFSGVVTAARATSGELRLASWSIDPLETTVTPVDEVADVVVNDVDIAHLGVVAGRDQFLTIVRDGATSLRLITWDVGKSGTISRLEELAAGQGTEIAVADGGDSHALTALRDASGNLKIIGWRIANDGSIERHGEAKAGSAKVVALGPSSAVLPTTRHQAVTAVRGADGDMLITSWEIALEP